MITWCGAHGAQWRMINGFAMILDLAVSRGCTLDLWQDKAVDSSCLKCAHPTEERGSTVPFRSCSSGVFHFPFHFSNKFSAAQRISKINSGPRERRVCYTFMYPHPLWYAADASRPRDKILQQS